jgi:hypothetical protein
MLSEWQLLFGFEAQRKDLKPEYKTGIIPEFVIFT